MSIRQRQAVGCVVLVGLGLFVAGALAQEPVGPTWDAPFWVLDGYGGIHSIAGAPILHGLPYAGFDIFKELEIIRAKCDEGVLLGVVLDGFGGVHKVSANPDVEVALLPNSPSFSFDAARDVVFFLDPDAVWHSSCLKK